MVNYRKNYLNIYIWQIVSMVLGLASLFIVTPFLSSDKMMYGIYSLCISLTVYFSYADLGVLSALSKYAAEYYINNDIKSETRIIGFSSFIMLITFSLISLVILFFAIYPRVLFSELIPATVQYNTARYLLLTVALSSPITVILRVLNVIFAIRVEDYKFQRFSILGNFIRILSVFFFFGNNGYQIVSYYVFYQLISILIAISCLFYVKKKYNYKLIFLIKSLKFSKVLFNKVKKLSTASFLTMVSAVLFYELDQIIISQLFGIKVVAIYAIAFSIFSIVRMYNSVIFSPYTSRFNHFSGLKDYNGLVNFANKISKISLLTLAIPIITLSVLSKPFIISWVGFQYEESALISSILILTFLFNIINMPASSCFTAMEKYRYMLIPAIINPTVYWLGIFLLSTKIGLLSFALSKLIALFVSVSSNAFFYERIFKRYGHISFFKKKLFLNLLSIVSITLTISLIGSNFMIMEHERYALGCNIVIMAICCLISFSFCIPFNDIAKGEVLKLKNKFNL